MSTLKSVNRLVTLELTTRPDGLLRMGFTFAEIGEVEFFFVAADLTEFLSKTQNAGTWSDGRIRLTIHLFVDRLEMYLSNENEYSLIDPRMATTRLVVRRNAFADAYRDAFTSQKL